MQFIKSFILAFSMFSKIPMIRVDWNKKNMRYMMCCFPFVGVVIAILEVVVCFLHATFLKNNDFLTALLFTLVPILLTGGIHIDGFMDTSDALGSHASIEKKLEILHDSHVGSFAVIGIVLYLLSFFVVSLSIFQKSSDFVNHFSFLMNVIVPFSSTFVISRFLSALAVATFPCAKNSGLVHTFADSAAKKFTAIWCIIFLILIYASVIFLFGKVGIVVCAVSLLFFTYYFFMSKNEFGGITGDLAGWFLQLCELLSLSGVLIFHLV